MQNIYTDYTVVFLENVVFQIPLEAVVLGLQNCGENLVRASPYAGGVQVGSPEPPFKINDIHSMYVVEVCLYIHIFLYKCIQKHAGCLFRLLRFKKNTYL